MNFDITGQEARAAALVVLRRAELGQVEDSADIKWYLEELDLTEPVYDQAYDILVAKLCH